MDLVGGTTFNILSLLRNVNRTDPDDVGDLSSGGVQKRVSRNITTVVRCSLYSIKYIYVCGTFKYFLGR